MPAAVKGKRATSAGKRGGAPASSVSKKARLQNKDEELSEGENEEDTKKKLAESEEDSDGDEIDGETVDETRLRLAKEYLKVQIH
jgi:hypothetical protein